MMEKLKKYRISIIFAIVGAISGFLYWRFVGCLSGTCAIKSVWYWTTLWGTAVGYLVGDMIREFLEKREKKRDERTL
jgi:phosphate/sulfate permease